MEELRKCIVNGEKVLFHGWTERNTVFIQANIALKEKDAQKYMEEYKKTDVLPSCFSAYRVSNTYAIIEDLEGNINLVEPEKVKFEKYKDVVLDTELPQKPLGGFEKFSRYFCPKCIEGVEVYESKCPRCGQKIDWSEV